MVFLISLVLCVNVATASRAPSKLSETGLYSDTANKVVAAENRTYAPQYPLWTDGAKKRRWVFLPKGKTIQADDPDQWIFPVGTKFWKEFAFERRVETRYIEKVSDEEWVYASYLWNNSETEAVLAPEDGVKDYYPISLTLKHTIPSVVDCQRCHRKQGDGILGFDALQLSNDRDPGALHGEVLEPDAIQLKTLIDEGKFNSAPLEFKNGNVRIPSSSPTARSVYGYLHSNCASCHSTMGSSMHVGMNLAFNSSAQEEKDLLAFQATVEKPCLVFQFPNEPRGIRVKKGDPEKSVLFRMMNTTEAGHMPSIGSVVLDVQAIQKIKEWISQL